MVRIIECGEATSLLHDAPLPLNFTKTGGFCSYNLGRCNLSVFPRRPRIFPSLAVPFSISCWRVFDYYMDRPARFIILLFFLDLSRSAIRICRCAACELCEAVGAVYGGSSSQSEVVLPSTFITM
jgi:hypothetical protein